MNLLAWISIFASGLCLAIGIAVYFLDRKALLNKLCAAVLVLNAYWAFSEFMVYEATTVETAFFWIKALFFYPFFSALMLHFTLVFTESYLLKSKLTYVFLYLPTSIFALVDLTTNQISALPVRQSWGYEYAAPTNSWIVIVDYLWVSTLALLSLLLCITYYLKTNDNIKKKQAKFVSIGIAFPVLTSIITDSILPMAEVAFPNLGNISGCIFGAFIAFAIWRYNLFNLNPTVAAETIVSTMPDSLILANNEGIIIQVNDALTKTTGYSEKELIGKQLGDLFLDEINGSETITLLKTKNEIKNIETKFRIAQEKVITVLLSASEVRGSNGKRIGFTCIVNDITSRKEMESKLFTAERFASIGELAGMVGHDLRNPLSSMKAATYYLKTKYSSKLDTKAIDMLSTIENSIEYSNKIVSDLLEYSREIKLSLESTSPKSLIASSLSFVDTPANIKVHDYSTDAPEMNVDAVKINRVFVNIIKNAFEAMPNGGTLTIKTENTSGMVTISFNDTGTGMTKEALNNLCKPLFTTKPKGMGFGLSICKRIIEAHGGKINAESIIGEGTTIITSFPIHSDMKTL